MTINSRNLGLSGGILWGLSMLVTTLICLGTGYGSDFLNVMAGIYPGYSVSLPGSVVGLIYGFLDGFIGLYVLAWIYNRLEKRRPA